MPLRDHLHQPPERRQAELVPLREQRTGLERRTEPRRPTWLQRKDAQGLPPKDYTRSAA